MASEARRTGADYGQMYPNLRRKYSDEETPRVDSPSKSRKILQHKKTIGVVAGLTLMALAAAGGVLALHFTGNFPTAGHFIQREWKWLAIGAGSLLAISGIAGGALLYRSHQSKKLTYHDLGSSIPSGHSVWQQSDQIYPPNPFYEGPKDQ